MNSYTRLLSLLFLLSLPIAATAQEAFEQPIDIGHSPVLTMQHGEKVSSTKELREISASGTALSTQAADRVRISLLLESTGKSAEDANLLVEAKNKRLKEAFANADLKFAISKRDEAITKSEPKSAALNQDSIFKVKRTLGVETTELEKAAKIIDLALRSGADFVSDVEFLVGSQGNAANSAYLLATKRAREKAQLLADALGVKLGKLISASLSEEPSGAALRRKMQFGEQSFLYSEEELQVFVNLEFEIAQ